MSAQTAAIITALKGDATLQGLMGSYGGASAWFSIMPTPGDADRPLGVVRPVSDPGEGLQYEAKDFYSREMEYEIDIFTDANGSVVALENVAERVRTLFHRQALSVTGFDTVGVYASGPIELPTDHTAYGRRVNLKLDLIKQ